MSQSGALSLSSSNIPSQIPINFVTNSGTAVPVTNILNVLGGNNISTSGSGNTVTVGVSGLTNNAMLIGNSSGGITSVGPATNGQILIGSTGNAPVLGTLTAGANITITNQAGGIVIASSGGGGGSGVQMLTGDVGAATAAANNINVLGTSNQIRTSGSSSTLTLSLIGPYTPSTYTLNGVLFGNGTSSIGVTAQGAANTVLLGNGGVPSFGAVPNAALANSSVTLTSGNNITVTGSPLSLGGTATIAVTGTTNHAVQVGNASGSLTSISTGTSGQLLQSAGAADPGWTTATYPATAGTSGNVLTSDGTNWISSAPVGAFTPNSTMNFFDDFIGVSSLVSVTNATQCLISNMGWTTGTSPNNIWGVSTTHQSSSHPGVITTSTVNSLFASANPNTSTANLCVFLGGGTISINWVVKIITVSSVANRYTIRIGLGDTFGADQANGVYFSGVDNVNSGNWVGTTASGSSRSTANSTVALASNTWYNLGITVNAAGTSAAFFINGTEISNSPIAANLPSTGLAPFVTITGSPPTTYFGIDLMYMTLGLTTPR